LRSCRNRPRSGRATNTPSLRSLKRRRHSTADHAGFELRHRDHLMQKEPASRTLNLRQIGEPYVHSSFEQARQKRNASGQPIDLTHH
jgi:hypothetical protein